MAATTITIPPTSNNAVLTATTGALSGDGTSLSKLAVNVDGTTLGVNGSNELEVLGGSNPFDQDLNTFDSPTFAGVTIDTITNTADIAPVSFQIDLAPSVADVNLYGVDIRTTTSGSNASGQYRALTVSTALGPISGYGIGIDNDADVGDNKTVAEWDSEDVGLSLGNNSTVTTYYGRYAYLNLALDGAEVGTAYMSYVTAPRLTGVGSEISGDWYGLYMEDVSATVVGGVKFPIYYAGGFTVGATGIVQAGGYKSSDGTAGATAGPFTTITAITVKNGLVTSITGS